MPKIKALQN
jgi:pimeloyl-ACP methyl ester carboxylesterase